MHGARRKKFLCFFSACLSAARLAGKMAAFTAARLAGKMAAATAARLAGKMAAATARLAGKMAAATAARLAGKWQQLLLLAWLVNGSSCCSSPGC